jgi:hypothetical protein
VGRVTAIDRSLNCVTPLALVLVTLKVNVPGEAAAVVVTVTVADAGSLESGGMVTLEGDSAYVTPEGGVPIQAAFSCAVSLTPFSDCSLITDDVLEEALSVSDCGETERL